MHLITVCWIELIAWMRIDEKNSKKKHFSPKTENGRKQLFYKNYKIHCFTNVNVGCYQRRSTSMINIHCCVRFVIYGYLFVLFLLKKSILFWFQCCIDAICNCRLLMIDLRLGALIYMHNGKWFISLSSFDWRKVAVRLINLSSCKFIISIICLTKQRS